MLSVQTTLQSIVVYLDLPKLNVSLWITQQSYRKSIVQTSDTDTVKKWHAQKYVYKHP